MHDPHGGIGEREDPAKHAHLGLGLATRVQLHARQFLARRAALGLTRRDVEMKSDPMRRKTMAVSAGIAFALVLCVGAFFWGLFKPAGSIKDSTIIADQDSDALYVRVGGTLYPVLNLTSARLIAGQADNPTRARRSDINEWPKGQLSGIAGAPTDLTATTPPTSSWLVCDTVAKTYGQGAPEPVTVTVIDGRPDVNEAAHRKVLGTDDAVLLKYGDDVWLIRDGRRSKVDPTLRPVLLALGLPEAAMAAARPMSQGLFNAIPVGPALTVPVIPGAGGPAGFANAPGPVGTVVSTPQVGGETTYSVVLQTGMELIPPVVARILENSGQAGSSVLTVAGPKLSALPMVNTLDVSVYPDHQLNFVDTQSNPSTCWWWQRGHGEPRATTKVVSGASVPIADDQVSKIVPLVKADKSGREADGVYFGPDYANYVASTGNDAASSTVETFWWIAETGNRFGVDRDQGTINALGIGTPTVSAPWAVLRLLAPSPELSKSDALVRHDSLPIDLNPGELPRS